MKFLLSWLKEYIDIQLPASEIAKKLTSAGLEVDSYKSCSTNYSGVVVGRVIKVQKHPNADKLCVAIVTDGLDNYQVVCGAPNCREGIKTAFARVGATLQDADGKTFSIKKSKLRDVESLGMLCSKKELQLSEEDEGIIEFADDIQEGANIAEMYGDILFEISLTPNLGHCSSLIGIARELSAANLGLVKRPHLEVIEGLTPIDQLIKVSLNDSQRCPRYACRIVQNVIIGPSPDWMQHRLTTAGIRPINNIVDITNYVALEMGQPLHAFDYDRLLGHEIIVRTASEGEKFITLDNQERLLNSEDLLICDREDAGMRPIALAGIMGGLNSEVHEGTCNVLIEAAHFNPSSIRRTSRRLGLQTDASKRFERTVDPNSVLWALDRAVTLMQHLAQGTTAAGVIDIKVHEFNPRTIACRLSRANQLLGTHLGVSEVENILDRLEFRHHWDGKDIFKITVPTYRADVLSEIDIIEEIARIYGYDNIPCIPPKYRGSQLPHAPMYLFEKKVRSHILTQGLQEFLTCDLIGPNLLNVVGETSMPITATVKVLNPTSIEQSVLRTSLLPGLLQVVKYNYDHQNGDLAGFEIGRIHFKDGKQYKEQSMLALISTGQAEPTHWSCNEAPLNFFDLKGTIETFLSSLGIADLSFKKSSLGTFHPGRQLAIYIGALEIGALGEVHPSIVKRLDIPERILFAEINLHDLYQMRKDEGQVVALHLFPFSDRDWTVTITDEMPIQEIFDRIRSVPSELLEKVTLIDLYESDKLGKNRRNATFHFVYRDKQKTIAQSAVDAEHARIIGAVNL